MIADLPPELQAKAKKGEELTLQDLDTHGLGVVAPVLEQPYGTIHMGAVALCRCTVHPETATFTDLVELDAR